MDKTETGAGKALLSLAEFSTYLGIGQTKAREILRDPHCTFSFRIGNRLYANKAKLDHWLNTHYTLD